MDYYITHDFSDEGASLKIAPHSDSPKQVLQPATLPQQ